MNKNTKILSLILVGAILGSVSTLVLVRVESRGQQSHANLCSPGFGYHCVPTCVRYSIFTGACIRWENQTYPDGESISG